MQARSEDVSLIVKCMELFFIYGLADCSPDAVLEAGGVQCVITAMNKFGDDADMQNVGCSEFMVIFLMVILLYISD